MGAPCFMLRTFFWGEGGRWFPNLPNPPAGPAAKRKRFARGSVCTVSFFCRLQQPDRSVFVRNRQEHRTLLRILVRSMQHKAERAVEAAEDHAVTAVLAEDRLRGRRPVPGNVVVVGESRALPAPRGFRLYSDSRAMTSCSWSAEAIRAACSSELSGISSTFSTPA
jgi:hypothetical protein